MPSSATKSWRTTRASVCVSCEGMENESDEFNIFRCPRCAPVVFAQAAPSIARDVGENLEPGDEDQVYFQDIDSFNRGVRYGDDGNDDFALFQKGSKNELGHVFTLEHALDVLLACSVRRNLLRRARADARVPSRS
jgi:predicted RNA-binding Zn-ribbon protein involved in translation (DUF1610 family)